jgi:hypothetical protein
MAQQRSVGATLFWLSLLFLLAAAVTCAAFAVFVPGPDRGKTFYVALSIVVAAELVFFAHLAHSALARAGVPTASAATRFHVHGLILLWFVLAVVTAIIAADPDRADTLAADRVLVVYLILTFLFFAAAYFVYSRDLQVEEADREVAAERKHVAAQAVDVEQVMATVRQLGRAHAECALAADGVVKKLDIVRSELEGALVSERGPDPGEEDWDGRLTQQLTELVGVSSSAAAAPAEKVPDMLTRIAGQADAILATMKQRERSLMC